VNCPISAPALVRGVRVFPVVHVSTTEYAYLYEGDRVWLRNMPDREFAVKSVGWNGSREKPVLYVTLVGQDGSDHRFEPDHLSKDRRDGELATAGVVRSGKYVFEKESR
jgi:hypothetical protein